MSQMLVPISAILGLSLILAAAIHAQGRVRSEQQRTLQKLIDHGLSRDELLRLTGIASPRQRDLRRGLLLCASAVGWSAVTYFIGGKAWLLGALPLALGLTYLVLGRLHDRQD